MGTKKEKIFKNYLCGYKISSRFLGDDKKGISISKKSIKKEEVKNIYQSALSNFTLGNTFFTSSNPNVQQYSSQVKLFDDYFEDDITFCVFLNLNL